MTLTATIYSFDIELADTDRHVYESLAPRLARHPSESETYLVARLLAILLEFTEGIEFSRGVADPDEPTIVVRDLTGAIKAYRDAGCGTAAQGVESRRPRRGLHAQGPDPVPEAPGK